jgi:RNA recognition motif-containing protein
MCSGRSEEAAEVIFERREDAIAAVKRYNNLQLDNKPMRIELIEAGGGVGGPGGARTLSSGIR